MSRIGKKPIAIPKGVTVKADASGVDVKGPKGQMKQALPPGIVAAVEDGTLVTKKSSDDAELNKFHGLARSLVNNAVLGVTEGWKKELDIVGVGYRAELKGQQFTRAHIRIRWCSTSRRDRRRHRQADAHHRDGRRSAAGRPGRRQPATLAQARPVSAEGRSLHG
jgi:ribosomal protein L6P/L9E